MCGIVGYIGSKRALPILIKGLKKLEYRGYDSAGVAYSFNQDIKIIKSVGRISTLEEKINFQEESTIGIGHTRWATHGTVDTINSHPHQVNNITMVHNGIIENYLELKELLQENGYTFQSATDTEVACAYIDFTKKKYPSWSFLEVLTTCMKQLNGSFAIVIMDKKEPQKLFVMKKDSPLVIGIGDKEFYIASDASAFLEDTNQYVTLDDEEIGILTKTCLQLFKNQIEILPQIKTITQEVYFTNKKHYEHYMMKEIAEQGDLIQKWNHSYFKGKEDLFEIHKYTKIQIIGCGTAYHAGLIGKYLLEEYSDFEINTYIASEYRYQKVFIDEKTLVIAISQSGETADTLACVKLAKEHRATTLGIVNVYDSSIARAVDHVIYTNAGSEIAVASTKAYVSQIYTLSLLALELGQSKGKITKEALLLDYQNLPSQIEELLKINYHSFAEILSSQKELFYLGRNIDYVSALEGSLKLKEITYIQSVAFPAGELKHGTISLIEKGTPVIAIITKREIASKTISNIKEVKARGAYVILIIQKDILLSLDKDCYDEIIYLPRTSPLLQPILTVIPLQLLAYYTAKRKGLDIDKPRNLAKSVTVE